LPFFDAFSFPITAPSQLDVVGEFGIYPFLGHRLWENISDRYDKLTDDSDKPRGAAMAVRSKLNPRGPPFAV